MLRLKKEQSDHGTFHVIMLADNGMRLMRSQEFSSELAADHLVLHIQKKFKTAQIEIIEEFVIPLCGEHGFPELREKIIELKT